MTQNVNNFRNDIWKSILNQIQHQRTLYGGDLVELNTLLHQSLQHLIDRHDRVNLHQHSIAFEVSLIDWLNIFILWESLPIFNNVFLKLDFIWNGFIHVGWWNEISMVRSARNESWSGCTLSSWFYSKKFNFIMSWSTSIKWWSSMETSWYEF